MLIEVEIEIAEEIGCILLPKIYILSSLLSLLVTSKSKAMMNIGRSSLWLSLPIYDNRLSSCIHRTCPTRCSSNCLARTF